MNIDQYLYTPEVDESQFLIATYQVESKKMVAAVEAIAIGQSIGNPNVRLENETDELLRLYLAKILDIKANLEGKKSATVRIAYPLGNLDLKEDGITQMLAMMMGGQMDIDIIDACRLVNVQCPPALQAAFRGPKIGMDEIRRRAGATDRPLIGGIVKPKTGMSPRDLRKVCIEMVRGGVDFIKEDEILGNPACCPFRERVPLVAEAVHAEAAKQGREVFYAPCINSDYPWCIERAQLAASFGANAAHINIWAGLPAYRAIRELDLPIALFFQKSGDKVMTCANHSYAIMWPVVTGFARMLGADFIHAGMWGGYLSDSEDVLDQILHTLRSRLGYPKTVPSFSCGSHPGLVPTTVKHFGTEIMMSSGAAIHGHPGGTEAGARAMRQACDAVREGGSFAERARGKSELLAAIEKWGYVDE